MSLSAAYIVNMGFFSPGNHCLLASKSKGALSDITQSKPNPTDSKGIPMNSLSFLSIVAPLVNKDCSKCCVGFLTLSVIYCFDFRAQN